MVREGSVELVGESISSGPCTSILVCASLPRISLPLLFVGSSQETLSVFSLHSQKLHHEYSIEDVGLVTALESGDLLNKGLTTLCCISAEGQLSLFLINERKSSDGVLSYTLTLCLRQLILSNICCALIEDIDSDGRVELVVALTDRIIRTYRYNKPKPNLKLTKQNIEEEGGKLVALRKWEVPAQTQCFSAGVSSKEELELIITQPLNRFVRIRPGLQEKEGASDSTVQYVISGSDSEPSAIYIPTNVICAQLLHTRAPKAFVIYNDDKMVPLQCPNSIFALIAITLPDGVRLLVTSDSHANVYIHPLNQNHSQPIIKVPLCTKLVAMTAYFDAMSETVRFVTVDQFHAISLFSTPLRTILSCLKCLDL